MYGSWDIKRKGQSFFVILGHVLTFDPPNNPKNQSFEKRTPGDISILHLCNTNDDHMMYGSWDTERDRQNFFSFWTIFWTFMPLPLTTERIKILKKWKKKTNGDIIILHKRTINDNHMIYGFWDMARDGCNCYFSIWTILFPFIPLTAQKMKISKKWKKTPGDIIILHMCTKNYD